MSEWTTRKIGGGISGVISKCLPFFNYIIYLFLIFNFLKFWPHHAACRILVPPPGIGPPPRPVPPAVETRRPNHWTTREFPASAFLLTLFQDGVDVGVQIPRTPAPPPLGHPWRVLGFENSALEGRPQSPSRHSTLGSNSKITGVSSQGVCHCSERQSPPPLHTQFTGKQPRQ